MGYGRWARQLELELDIAGWVDIAGPPPPGECQLEPEIAALTIESLLPLPNGS